MLQALNIFMLAFLKNLTTTVGQFFFHIEFVFRKLTCLLNLNLLNFSPVLTIYYMSYHSILVSLI